MSNIVRVDVTGSNTSGAAVNTAERDVKKLGESAKEAAKKTVELRAAEKAMKDEAREAARQARELGTRLDGAGDQASQMARKLLEAKAAARLAANEFDGTEKSINRFNEAQAAFAKLASVAKNIDVGVGKSRKSLFDQVLPDEKSVERAGKAAAGTFASAFEGGLMGTFKSLPAEAKAALGAAVGGAAIAAAPLVVSAINGAILGGIGAGGLAAGIAIQARDPVVSGAFKDLGSRIMKDLTEDTKPFRGQLLDSVTTFGTAWDKIEPNMEGVFSKLAPAIGKLSEGAAKAVTILGPALERAAGPAAQVLAAVGEEIPHIAREVGRLLDDISEHGDSAAAAIRFILISVEALILGFDALVQTVGPAADTITHMAEAMHLINAGDVTHQLSDLAGTVDDATGTFNGLTQATYNTADAANAVNSAFERLFGEMMGQDEANLKVAEDFRQLTSEIKRNGKTLDENTQGGQANRRMLLGMIGDLEAKREADIAAGNGTVEATQKANAAYLQQLQKLRAVAAAAGLPTAAIDALIGKYRQLANMPDITKNINIIHTNTYRTNGTPQAGFSRVPGEAHGGVSGVSWAAAGGPRNGLTWVGEEGPELISLPSSTTVYTAGQSARMAAGMGGGMGGGQTLAVLLQVDPGSSDDWLAQAVMAGMREKRITVSARSVVS